MPAGIAKDELPAVFPVSLKGQKISGCNRFQIHNHGRIVIVIAVGNGKKLQPFSQIQVKIVQNQPYRTFYKGLLCGSIRTCFGKMSAVIIGIVPVVGAAGKGLIADIIEADHGINIGKIFFCFRVGLLTVDDQGERADHGYDQIIAAIIFFLTLRLRKPDNGKEDGKG